MPEPASSVLCRLPPGAAAERRGPADGAVQLLAPLRRPLLPDLQGPQAANQQPRRV